MKLVPYLLIAAALFVVYACSPKPVYVPISERANQPSEQGVQEGVQRQDSQAEQDRKARQRAAIEEELLQRDLERQKMLQEQMKKGGPIFKDILFEFNGYSVPPDYQPLINDIAAWLTQNKAAKLTVEGHCDERGTIEYNLALGEKRAESVKNQLVKAGVKEDRIKTISYGKEAPADPGHTEEAWAKNRRAHFKID
jgi:peptidoglycan-associated lipoprotein